MSLELLNPDTLPAPFGYTQVVRGRGSTTLYTSGQVSLDAGGNVVGEGDLDAQLRQAFANLVAAVEAGGGRLEQLAKITAFIVGYQPDHRLIFAKARDDTFGAHQPASTLLGVQSLAVPQFLAEVEGIAVLD